MKMLSMAMLLVLSAPTFAETFSCKAMVGDDEGKTLITVSDNKVEFEGRRSFPIIEKVETRIDGQAIKNCMQMKPRHQRECITNIIPNENLKDGDSVRSLYLLLPGMPNETASIPEYIFENMDLPKRGEFKYENIASGVLHVLKHDRNYPNIGIYEYLDKDGKVLNRFWYELVPRGCK